MTEQLPPTIDQVAAARWQAQAPQQAPWLHEEVARRMHERLSWIVRPPGIWCDWDPLRGGTEGHALVAQHFPQAECLVAETSSPTGQALARKRFTPSLWERLRGAPVHFGMPQPGSVQMLWANMALHMAANPQALIGRWSEAIATDGYLMFSCLGPDTLRELRAVYDALGWPAPGHAFTDMHDWGDMLVRGGFAEPVMDMERIVLTFATPERALQELRELGRNLHVARFAGLRGRHWRAQLLLAMAERLADPAQGGQLALTFEIVYGHAFKAPPRAPLSITRSAPAR